MCKVGFEPTCFEVRSTPRGSAIELLARKAREAGFPRPGEEGNSLRAAPGSGGVSSLVLFDFGVKRNSVWSKHGERSRVRVVHSRERRDHRRALHFREDISFCVPRNLGDVKNISSDHCDPRCSCWRENFNLVRPAAFASHRGGRTPRPVVISADIGRSLGSNKIFETGVLQIHRPLGGGGRPPGPRQPARTRNQLGR